MKKHKIWLIKYDKLSELKPQTISIELDYLNWILRRRIIKCMCAHTNSELEQSGKFFSPGGVYIMYTGLGTVDENSS